MSAQASPFCEHCGAANDSQAILCCFCGHSLQDTPVLPAAPTVGNLLVDTVLKGRYRITAPLSQGGMSMVYRAQDIELNNRTVVVKELHLSGLGGQDAQDAATAFKREATILASLQHANLPSIFEHFEEQGHWYLVMSFIQGEALDDYLNRSQGGKLPLRDVLQIGQQLCAVLHYLHSHYPPIIFRDLKPANIIRTPAGHVYLIDFGVARYFKPGQKKDTVPFGSMGYAPPEQFGKSQTTPRSDIYSLGATLYQLLSGHEPDTTPFRFPPLLTLEPTLPMQLVDLITQMLSKEEQKRPANMLIIEQKLHEINNNTKTVQPFSSFTPTPSVPKKFRRVRLALSVAFLALCCLLVSGVGGGLVGYSTVTTAYQADATATTTTVDATATAVQIAAFPDPYQPKGTLALIDSLDHADNAWQEYTDTDWGGSCLFQDGVLQISQTKTDRLYNCDDRNADAFTNFAMQVQMTIIQGDCGGIEFRNNGAGSQFYYFAICADSIYHLYHYTGNATANDLTVNHTNAAIHQGTQTNTLAVVANGNNFDLYVNDQKIDTVSDGSYATGTIGLIATNYTHATTVSFQNVRVWTLS